MVTPVSLAIRISLIIKNLEKWSKRTKIQVFPFLVLGYDPIKSTFKRCYLPVIYQFYCAYIDF